MWPFSVPIHWRSHLKKQSHDPDVMGQVQNGICQVSEKMRYANVRVFTTINAFFVNVNKSSFPKIIHKQSESASFVTLVEIHNVDVPVTSSQDATVLSPTAGTLQWPSAIAVNFKIESDSCSDSLT